MIDPAELDSIAHSPFAKEKADAIIAAAAITLHVTDDDEGYADDLRFQHETLDFRLVPRQVLEDTLETIQTLSFNYHKLMEETAPLIIEAAKTPGNRWSDALKALDQARNQE